MSHPLKVKGCGFGLGVSVTPQNQLDTEEDHQTVKTKGRKHKTCRSNSLGQEEDALSNTSWSQQKKELSQRHPSLSQPNCGLSN